MSDVGWVAHVLLLFNLIGLIGPLAIPPNDQLRGLARARLSFSESSWASRDGGMSNISVFASFSRQIHPIGRPMRAMEAAEATETLSNRVPSRRLHFASAPTPLSVCLQFSTQCQTWYTHGSEGTRRQKANVTRRAVPLN